MTERHVLDHLPLWVEGDLEPREMAAVEAHLATCADCRAAAETFRESQAWLKEDGGIPFDLADRAALRADVMARLRADAPKASSRAPRPLWIRPALALAAATLLLMFFLPVLRRRSPAQASSMVAEARPGAFQPSSPAQPTVNPETTPITALPSLSSGDSRPIPSSSRAGKLQRLLPVNVLPDATVPVPEGPARLELQTSNPNVRIIWLARAQAHPDESTQPLNPI